MYTLRDQQPPAAGERDTYGIQSEVKETVQTRVIPIEWLVLAAVFVGLVIVLICGISRRRKKRRNRNGRESDCRDIKKRNTDEEKT